MLTTRTRIAIRHAAGDIRAAFLPLLGFDLIVAAVSALVFTPLIAWIFKRLVASTGKNVLSDMALFIDRGVDGIITDVPKLLNSVISQLNEASLAERLLLRFSNEIGLEPGESKQ